MAKTKLFKSKQKAQQNKNKRDLKKLELAMHTLATLSQLGYANTSLRDIAEQSGVSVGVLHYYFEDKVDLITHCVLLFKNEFISRLDIELQLDGDKELVIHQIVESIAETVESDAEAHRLWFDIRAQAMFDPAFQDIVQDLEEAMIALSRRFLDRLGLPNVDEMDSYFAVDGRFRYYLQKFLSGDEEAISALKKSLLDLFLSLPMRNQT